MVAGDEGLEMVTRKIKLSRRKKLKKVGLFKRVSEEL